MRKSNASTSGEKPPVPAVLTGTREATSSTTSPSRGGSRSSRGRARRRARAAEAAAAAAACTDGSDNAVGKSDGKPTRGSREVASPHAGSPSPRPPGRTGSSRSRAKAEARGRARAEAEGRERELEKERELQRQREEMEAETRRQEEEAKQSALEAEKREAAEKALLEEARALAKAAREKAMRRLAERERNLAFTSEDRPSERDLRRLESSLKKCTGFVRRISAGGPVGGGSVSGGGPSSATGAVGSLSGSVASSTSGGGSGAGQAGSVLSDENFLRECRSLNLTRYISEVVASISEARIRASDAEGAALLCGEMYRRYDDFRELLLNALTGVACDVAREPVLRRSAVRLLSELVSVGIVDDYAAVFAVIKEAMKGGRGRGEPELTNMSVVAVFAKTAGRVFLDKLQRNESFSNVPALPILSGTGNSPESKESCAHEDDPLVWEDNVLPDIAKSSMTATLQTYLRDLISLLGSIAECLHTADSAVLMSRVTRGVEDEGALSDAVSARKHYDRVFSAVSSIADALGRTPPAAYVFDAEEVLASAAPGRDGARIVVGAFGGGRGDKQPVSEVNVASFDGLPELGHPFDDDEELAFYRNLRCPSRAVGSGQRGSDSQDSSVPDVPPKEKGGKGAGSPSGKVLESPSGDGPARDKARSSPTAASETVRREVGSSKGREAGDSSDGSRSQKVGATGHHLSLDSLLSRLHEVDTTQSAEAFVEKFCALSEHTRQAPKRLIRSLAQVSSHLVNVIPICARIAASLQPRFPEISSTVSATVEDDLRQLIHRAVHDEKSFANCVRTSRYFGEFVKFELIPANTFFELLGLCVKDFTGHKIDIACNLLESCGRYLYRSPTTSVRMGNLLDTIWRLKSVRNLEDRHNALVETAFFASRPRSGPQVAVKKRLDPVREYIRWRIYSQLCEANVDWTAAHFRKLPWDDDLESFVVSLFLDVCCLRFSMLRVTTKLLASLSRDRHSVGVAVCDGVLEAISVGLERNDGRDSQRRVAEVMLLGELFNCGLLPAVVVFEVLYEFIVYGHAETRSGSSVVPKSADGKMPFVTSESMRPYGNGPQFRQGVSAGDDAPGDFFRLRLTCALLDICGSRLASPSSSKKFAYRRHVEVFWIYLERYMMLKTIQAGLENRLPLYMEHIVGDTYDSIVRPRSDAPGTSKSRKGSSSHLVGGSSSVVGSGFGGIVGKNTESKNVPGSGAARRVPRYASRCSSLEDAVAAVQEVERTSSDLSCVLLPQRMYIRQERTAVNRGDTSPVSATTGVDADVSPSSEIERDDDSEDDTTTNGNCSDLSSNEGGSSISGDREDDFSSSGSEELDDELDADADDDDIDDDDDDYVVSDDRKPKTDEEDEFERELAAVMASDIHSAKVSFTGHTALDRMAIPIGLMAKHEEMERVAATAATVADLSGDGQGDGPSSRSRSSVLRQDSRSRVPEPTVTFKMLVRRGGKSQIRDLDVPSASALAVATKESESQGAAAHEEVKRLVLGSSTVVNGAEDDRPREEDILFDPVAASRRKERSISEQRAADEQALLSTLFRSKPR